MNALVIILLILGFILALAVYFITVYNKLVSLATHSDEGWSGIDVQLKRRHDLIPNLVAVVKQYSIHEKEVFQKVAELRSVAMNSQDVKEVSRAEGQLSQTLKTLFAVSENYPELKANQNFLQLQDKLSVIEDELQLARRYYNATVRDYNMRIQSFPVNLAAGSLGFSKRDYFQLEGFDERNAPKIGF